MAWSYQDWITQSGEAAILARLLLHIAEVSAGGGKPDVSDGTYSRGAGDVTPYLRMLLTERERLERRIALVAGGRVSHIRKARP